MKIFVGSESHQLSCTFARTCTTAAETSLIVGGLVYMVRVYDIWDRLVRATLRREQLRLIGQRTPSDLSIVSSSSSFNFNDSSPTVSSLSSPNLLVGQKFGYNRILSRLPFRTRKRGAANQRGVGVGPIPGTSLKFSCPGDIFTYQQILHATGKFDDDNLIRNGHSGDLFRGLLEGGIPVIIKRIDLHSVNKEACTVELDFFSVMSHTRLVPLLGHCWENGNEKFLVYKYMPNGDLSNSLFRKNNSDDDSLQSLDWITRLKIAIGAAEGLSYLHHECTPSFVHRDVQASSILLDDKFEVRLGSLSEVCTQEGDNHQNRIIRLLQLPRTSEQGTSGIPNATCAYDVYCFGKIWLELVTGKLGISATGDAAMKQEWLEQTIPYISIYDKELVTNIVDPSLIIDEDLLEEVWAMAIVARSCLNPKSSRRPLMRYVLKALENPLKLVREENTTFPISSWNAAFPVSSADGAEGASSLNNRFPGEG